MEVTIGIDVGGSNTKIAAVNSEGKLISYRVIDAALKDIEEQVCGLVRLGGYSVDNIAITGVGSYRINDDFLGKNPYKSHEFTAIGLGGLTASGLNEAIVVSMGTGTAFIHSKGDEHQHIIGTGVGGGTLLGLCRTMAGTGDIHKIEELVKDGNLGKVDLTMGEITQSTLPSLDPNLTASNLAGIKADAVEADIALGAMNLVLEVIGTMSILAAMTAGTNDIVLTGFVSGVSRARETYNLFSRTYGYNFIIPENAVCSTAIGAALDCMRQSPNIS